MKWISIKKDLPNDNESVLIFNGEIREAVFWKKGCRGRTRKSRFEFPNCGQEVAWYFEDVTHWMPLPNPPSK